MEVYVKGYLVILTILVILVMQNSRYLQFAVKAQKIISSTVFNALPQNWEQMTFRAK